MLKSLELTGFKSFAKKTSLEFKSKITAIVGPNGSGKSNIAEAFRFSLGEQSIKSMRGKRGEDLIWNGSSDVARSNRAAVKLVFDNSKKIFKIDFDLLSIERIVGRDGVNEYKMNQSPVRLKDIAEKLGEAHIGTTSHHIISQGEADRVLRASSKERREILEDALGLKTYQYKKIEGEKKLEQAKVNMREVDLLRKEIAPHLRFLKKQVEKAEKAKEIIQELAKKYRIYLKTESVYIEKKRKLLKDSQEPLISEQKKLEEKMERARELLSKSSSKDNKSEHLLNIETKLKNLHTDKEKLERELGKIEGELSSIERIEKEIHHNTSSDTKVSLEIIKELSHQVDNDVWKSQSITNLEELRLLLIEIGNKIKSFINHHQNDVNEDRQLSTLNNKNELIKRKNEVEDKIKNIEETLSQQDKEYKEIKISIEKEEDSGRETEREMFKISSMQTENRNKIEKFNTELRLVDEVEEKFKEEALSAGILLGTNIIGLQNEDVEQSIETLLRNRYEQEERRKDIERLKIRLEESGGTGGAEIFKEYQETQERDHYLEKELGDIERSIDSLEAVIKDLDEKLKNEFARGLKLINDKFGEFFKIMFDGGEAKLVVEKIEKRKPQINSELGGLASETEETADTQEGVDISLSLPRKNIKNLEMLSGGERALTSIALIFAMSQVNPPPFIILDETDAALDEANSKRYGDMIEELSKYSQLILITHNRETMSRAGVIYGVTMGKDGVSRLLSIAFDEAAAVAK